MTNTYNTDYFPIIDLFTLCAAFIKIKKKKQHWGYAVAETNLQTVGWVWFCFCTFLKVHVCIQKQKSLSTKENAVSFLCVGNKTSCICCKYLWQYITSISTATNPWMIPGHWLEEGSEASTPRLNTNQTTYRDHRWFLKNINNSVIIWQVCYIPIFWQ